MAKIKIKNLTFKYPNASSNALENINLEINQGDFVVICGASGSGKTTLAKCIKQSIAPFGDKSGEIYWAEETIEKLSLREEACQIGFVFQNPAEQIVTDTIGCELAFGLENIGMDQQTMSLRVAETADYFGFTKRMDESIEHLSGGQQQLLNIASIMTMQPTVIILDEPTAQLDPVAAENLLLNVQRINRDFGITIIIIEHKLDRVVHIANKLVIMENGKIIASDTPKKSINSIKDKEFFGAMPQRVKIYAQYEKSGDNYPLTVGQARAWLADKSSQDENIVNKLLNRKAEKKEASSTKVIQIKELWFRYERNSEDVLKGVTLDIRKGAITGVVGGNGSGKSTLLSLIKKLCKPYSGKCKVSSTTSLLMQDVQCLLSKEKVVDELTELCNDMDRVNEVIEQMELSSLLGQHPNDLSGGEQQRLGIGKLLLTDANILLMDEPTKGMDDVYKDKFGKMLREMASKGKSIVIVSHDLEFLSEYTDTCAMLFNGQIVTHRNTEEFFRGNSYYTTELEKLCRKY